MTYRNNARYLSFKQTSRQRGNLGSASRFINFVRKQERETDRLWDEPKSTESQDVFSSLDTQD